MRASNRLPGELPRQRSFPKAVKNYERFTATSEGTVVNPFKDWAVSSDFQVREKNEFRVDYMKTSNRIHLTRLPFG
jgi:hypothetical protein